MCKVYRDPADCHKAPACETCPHKGAYGEYPDPCQTYDYDCAECKKNNGSCEMEVE